MSAPGLRFTHDTLPQRVVFATGAADESVGAELRRLHATRPMMIASARNRRVAESLVGDTVPAAWFEGVVQHVHREVAEQGRKAAVSSRADLLVAVGGGSTTGMAKAIALKTGIPILAVPTTYAGSEATNIWGLTDGRRKSTGTDPAVLPVSVVYDAELTLTLPQPIAIASGLNALAHCIDALWAPRADPVNRILVLEGARLLNIALRAIAQDRSDLASREQALYACYLSAAGFASAGAGLHHKVCHVLGGTFDLPHAQTHAVVLPHVLAFNAPAIPDLEARLAAALGARTAIEGIAELIAVVEAPRSLRELGLNGSSIGEATDLALTIVPASNPRLVTKQNLTALLQDAWCGARPRGTTT